MIPQASNYDFTNVSPASCIAGGTFGGAMAPRLEELLWLEESVRTAECRGGFDPFALTYPAIGTKSDSARMSPRDASLSSLLSRLNAVLTKPYHAWDSLPGGVWAGYPDTLSRPNAVGVYSPVPPWISQSTLDAAVSAAVTTPAAATISQSIWPTATQAGAWRSAIDRATSQMLYRSTAVVTSGAGLDNVIDTSAARSLMRNGVAGNTPMQDWAAGFDNFPNPLFNELQSDPTKDNTVDYYRVVTGSNDVAYSRETSTWFLQVGLPPWTYTGTAYANKRTDVRVMLVWYILAAPLWKRTSDGAHVRDKTVTRLIWSGATNSSMFGAMATRTTSGMSFQFPGGPAATIIRTFGDHICRNVVNTAALASSGIMGNQNATRVGYVLRADVTAAIYVASTAARDVGS